MSAFLTDQDVREIGMVLGQNFPEGTLVTLVQLLSHAAEACDYAAEDYAYRADFDNKHPPPSSSESEYGDAADGYTRTGVRIAALAESITVGEKAGRDE